MWARQRKVYGLCIHATLKKADDRFCSIDQREQYLFYLDGMQFCWAWITPAPINKGSKATFSMWEKRFVSKAWNHAFARNPLHSWEITKLLLIVIANFFVVNNVAVSQDWNYHTVLRAYKLKSGWEYHCMLGVNYLPRHEVWNLLK